MSSAVATAGRAPQAGQHGPQRVAEVSGSPVPAGALSLEQAVRPFGVPTGRITVIDGKHSARGMQ